MQAFNGPISRRGFVRGSGALALGSLVAPLLESGAVRAAEPVRGGVPEIDRLAVTVVVDSYQVAVAPNLSLGNLQVRRFGFALGDHPPGAALASEFGLSLHARSERQGEVQHVLVDFGYTPAALINNLSLLGIDPAAIDALVLSHGHYDHFGGLVGFLSANRDGLKPALPFFIGGEECFCARQWLAPPMKGDFGALDRSAIEAAKLSIMTASGPAMVGRHGFTTGPIDLSSFEKVLSPSAMKIGLTNGFGCYPEAFTEEERQKGTLPDQFRNEIGTAFNLRGRGLVVLTSCSHRGVVNVIRQAQAESGLQKVHAVIGGFHLAPQKEDYVRQVVATLREAEVDYVVPLHCSGEPFYEIMKAELPQKLVRGYTGSTLVFSA